MLDKATGTCPVFNGKIYIFRHVRNYLAADGVRLCSTRDTEVMRKASANCSVLRLRQPPPPC